ncbi:MAG: zinc ABC transporter substrate-binding protein [Hyphomicrobiaceae bacterium]|nr:zinc ABC transporter substrate-binding protein [Hyphomicrobiaceae bacterium]
MPNLKSWFAAVVSLAMANGPFATLGAAAELTVVVSSKPVHSLTAAVMEGIGQPRLIVDGNASPHTFTLKPSAAKAISTADVFVRISESIEPFTGKIIKTLPKSVTVMTLAETPGLELLQRRKGGSFEGDGHKGHDHDHDHDHNDKGGTDGHVWLDPVNARKMLSAITAELSRKAPQHRERFEANAKATEAKIAAVADEIAARMKPLAGRPFVLFHDATQYFERRFGLAAAGSITVSPDVQPSAKRLNAVRSKIKSTAATCVFREPGYQEKLVAAVTEGTDAKAGLLDPEAINLEPGPGLYVELLKQLAAGFSECLAVKS